MSSHHHHHHHHHRDHHDRQREYKYTHNTRRKRIRDPRKHALDIVLFILAIVVPVTGGAMWFAEIDIPVRLLGAYTAIVQTIAGFLFLLFTARGVGGFGKASYFFSRTYYGKRWVSTREAKGNTYLVGGILLVIGILIGLLTIKFWNSVT